MPRIRTDGHSNPSVYIHYGTITLIIFEKTKIPGPEMEAKLNSMTLLLINFFNFFEPFRSRLAS
jgi:hypothetical protein